MRARHSGVAALEFGLMAPVWTTLVMFMLDFGEMFYLKMKLATAVSTAAYFAFLNAQMVTASQVSSFIVSVQSVGQTTASLSAPPVVTVLFNNAGDNSNSANYYCVSGASPAVFTSTGTSSASCGGSVLSGKYVTVTVAGSMTTFFANDPFLGSTLSASDGALVRFE